MQLLRDGVMNLEFAAQLLKRGIQVPRVYAGEPHEDDENEAALRKAEDYLAAEAERDRLRAKLRAQLN